jgi:hypothetical protein
MKLSDLLGASIIYDHLKETLEERAQVKAQNEVNGLLDKAKRLADSIESRFNQPIGDGNKTLGDLLKEDRERFEKEDDEKYFMALNKKYPKSGNKKKWYQFVKKEEKKWYHIFKKEEKKWYHID